MGEEQVITIYMKTFLTIILAVTFTSIASGQTDTIIVENIVKFYVYNDKNYPNTDAVDFILKVTNHSKIPIPDLSVTNRSVNVNFYINGKIDNPLSLYNGPESDFGGKIIAIDSTEKFDSGGWVLTAEAGIITKYGNEFTVQWEYMKLKSKIVKANDDLAKVKFEFKTN